MQKRYLVIVIIGIIVVLGVFLLVALVGSRKTLPQTTDFDKVESDSYIFYYPRSYVEGELGEKDVLNYMNSDTGAVDSESIFLRIETRNTRAATPTYQDCLKLAEMYRQKGDDEIKAEIVRGGLHGGEGVGCKIVAKSKIEGVNDSVVIVEKILWHDSGDDYSIYRARTAYYANASSGESDALNLAIDQFTLK
ncbi:hypothetical protein KKG24_01875 [Patescibacteria group bacterium]|nr:hypothetical protein [Patescibacteria group bacterium]